MKCHLIQTTKLNDVNKAEKAMLEFLAGLSADYFIYRELKLTPAYEERVRGLEQKQPDFVVASPETGVVSIEVKDWNLTENTYEWQDQYKIKKIQANGQLEEIHNPAHQAETYLYALMELLSGLGVYITSLVAFPRVTRQQFLNRLQKVDLLQNPQTRFLLDIERVIFKEDMDENFNHPERLLTRLVRLQSRFYPASVNDIDMVNQRILPNSFRIGDFTRRQINRQQLKMITQEQQKWIFSQDRRANYLLDVAGSGKTNTLVSKAIYVVDEALKQHQNPPNILLTTYNDNLANNIRRIFSHKLPNSKERRKYQEALTIWSIPTLMRQIVQDFYKTEAEHQSEVELVQMVDEILRAEPDKYRYFDYLFIDEIQDFDDFFLIVAKHLCRSDNFFFVGDIGQKIYERSHHLERLGLVPCRIELKKSYKMFRTPRYIAELATRFIFGDPWIRKEFEQNGYTEKFECPNQLLHAAEILRTSRPELDIIERIQALLNTSYTPEDLMVITSEVQLSRMAAALTEVGVPFHLGETEQGDLLTLVDFMNVKGLEKEVVFVAGIEHLYDRSKSEGLFADEEQKVQRERLSRRKIYVALTRPLEELFIYYTDSNNRFIAELLRINNQILAKRIEGN